MQKEQYLKIVLAMSLVAILVLVWVNYVDLGNNNDDERPNVNEGLTSLTDFDVVCDELGSSAKGTVFVMQGDDSLHVKIVADVVVGANDLGGAMFYFNPDLKVTDVLCSFNGDTDAWEHLNIMYGELNTWVYVGYQHHEWGSKIPDPGQGTVIIDLQLSGNTALDDIDSLHFDVYVGGNDSVMGIAYETIDIPLLHDDAP